MATYIQAAPSTNGTTVPSGAGSLIRSDEWGIDNTLSNFIVQNEKITKEPISDQTPDQKGAVVSELDFDYHWTLSLEVIGDKDSGETLQETAGDTTFAYAGAKWKLKNVAYTGTYNGKKKWSITAERWVNFPAQS